MQVKILNVDIENVVKGKNRYSVATVAYMSGGEARTQKIMSFANPDVFKKVQELVGQETNVTVTKNDGGYNQWSAIGDNAGQAPAATTAPGTQAVTPRTGSTYETPQERAAKQVYIVKQSSISSAIDYLKLNTVNPNEIQVDQVLNVAQRFVDFVFDTSKEQE